MSKNSKSVKIPEKKLKAFSIGSMGKRALSKKEIEEQKKKEEDEAAALAFKEFVDTFSETPSAKASKVWVKAGTYDAGRRVEDTKEKGKLYKPQSKIAQVEQSSAERAQEYAKLLGEKRPEKPGKKRVSDKKKSNLELFKEELKMIQEEREERHKYKNAIVSGEIDVPPSADVIPSLMSQRPIVLPEDVGSLDCSDPTTTNIYLGNLNPKITEQELMELFGRYGPLASIKIMWPRTEEEKARGKNCGFVAFMNRKDGERAMRNLSGKDIMAYEMKLGWGKNVPIPHHPIYIPPKFVQLTMPPPPSGLPFNAQPSRRDRYRVTRMLRNNENITPEEMEKILYNSTVKVVIPLDRQLLMIINRTIEFVIREGPMFEAMIMNRELLNPTYRFLFENQSPAHVYYRWKLFSMSQGDSPNKWPLKEFRMFIGGSVWKPPPLNQYTQGMPDDLVEEQDDEPRKGTLSTTQRERLEDLLRNITPERIKVAEAMVFCIEHAEAAEEICDCIAEALSATSTRIHKKIARLYLISDILHNCTVKISNASNFRRGLESRLMQIFADVNIAYMKLESRMKAEAFKLRVMTLFRAWEDWAIYPRDFLIRLQNTFLGLSAPPVEEEPEADDLADTDIDGAPMEDGADDEDIDGVPLDGAALIQSAIKRMHQGDDLDGVPCMYYGPVSDQESVEDIDGVPFDDELPQPELLKKPAGGFVPSKWETVDPEQVEAQAMTTSKWDQLEPQQKDDNSQNASLDSQDDGDVESQDGDETGDSGRMNEIRRALLREVEVKVIAYQDELESGQRKVRPGWNIQQQVQHMRRKLLKKVERGRPISSAFDSKDDTPDRKRKHSPSSSRRKPKRNRSSSSDSPPTARSRGRSRSRSYSPIRKSSSSRRRSFSPSPPPYKRSSPHSSHRSSPSRKHRTSSPSRRKHRVGKEKHKYKH